MMAAVYGVPVEIHLHRDCPWIIPLEQNGNERN
jgi:hypothetical protein